MMGLIEQKDIDLLASYRSGVMNSTGNFSNYRKHELGVNGPIIPYLALHLGDLVHISENKLFNADGDINATGNLTSNKRKKQKQKQKCKRNMMSGNLFQHAKTILKLREFQTRALKYSFKPVAEIKSVLHFPPHFPSEPDGDNLSRAYEPRKIKK